MLRLAKAAKALGIRGYQTLALGLKPTSAEYAANHEVNHNASPNSINTPLRRGFLTCTDPTTRSSSVRRSLICTVQAMQALLQMLHEDTVAAVAGGGDAASRRHLSRGKLLPRDRIAHICDPGSPFLELSPLAGKHMYGASGEWHQSSVIATAPVALDA